MNDETDRDEIFPLADVEASLADRRLQRDNRIEAMPSGLRDQLEEIRRAAIADGASERAEWIYFSSPNWTWEQLCGREGWLLFDRGRRTQHAFHLIVMN